MQSWTLDPILHPWLLAIVGGILASLLLLRPQFGWLSKSRRWTLVSLRGCVLLLALTLMLRPGCVTTVEQQQKAVLLMLLDASRSMELPHAADEQTRWEKMKLAIQDSADQIAQLEEQRIELKVFGFDNQLTRVPVENGLLQLDELPEGPETDYATSLDEAIRSVRNQRVIGAILHGDGRHNALDPRIELNQAATQMDQAQIPLYVVPYGRPADSGIFADIAVSNMPDNYTGFVKNRQVFTATVSARGFANRTIPVQLEVTDPAGETSVADVRQVTFRGADQKALVSLGFEPELPGQYRVRVKAQPQSEEVSPRNNELPAFLTVFDGGLKVLLVTGNIGAEQRFLRQSIGSSAEIKMDPVIIPARDRGNWVTRPRDFSDKFSDPSYDVIILADIDARALYQKGFDKNFKAIEKAVLAGKGLLMTGGYHSFGPGGYAMTPLEDLLPVLMETSEIQDFDGRLRKELHIEKPIKLKPVGQHFLNRITGDDQSDGWEKLPPLLGANRFLKHKDSAQVLLRSDGGEPILIATQVGGRVAAFAGDSTWRWWMAGFEEQHKRFWRQMILWLAFRDTLTNNNVWINLPQRRFAPRSELQFQMGAKNQLGLPITDAQFDVGVVGPDGVRREAVATRADQGKWKVQWKREETTRPGLYRIEVTARNASGALGSASAEFIVFDQDREKSVAAADPEQLIRLANQTQQWGGRMLTPEELPSLLEQILANPPDMKVEIPQKWKLGDTWLGGILVLLLFVILLAAEWICRKRWGMV